MRLAGGSDAAGRIVRTFGSSEAAIGARRSAGRDRLSWLRFREKLTETGALNVLFADFDRQLKKRGFLAMGGACQGSGDAQHRWKAGGGGQIVDATLVAAPKQRNTAPEKDAIKAGKKASEIWPDEPARAAQKDTDARWTLKFAEAKPLANGKPGIDIAIPSFG